MSQKSISVSADMFAAISSAADRAGIPKSAVVEIIAARAIGMPDADLPAAVRAWVTRFDETFAGSR